MTPAATRAWTTSQAGRPTTHEYEPSMPSTMNAPSPWMA